MPEKEDPEDTRRKVRRKLLKLGVYSIPLITTIVAGSDTVEATLICGPRRRCMPKSGLLTKS